MIIEVKLTDNSDRMWEKVNLTWAKFNIYLGKIQLSLTAIFPLEYAAIFFQIRSTHVCDLVT